MCIYIYAYKYIYMSRHQDDRRVLPKKKIISETAEAYREEEGGRGWGGRSLKGRGEGLGYIW